MDHWKRTLFIVCAAQLLTMIAFSSYHPSIPFYIQEMGDYSIQEVTRWIAAFGSGAAIAMMIASPLWGSLADRYGRKMMLLRATVFGALLAFAMGLAQTPAQLVTMRTIQGIFSGTVSAAMTLVATQTPDEHMGTSLGVMQTIQYAGHAVGPLVGGLVADNLGLRAMFPVSASLMAIASLAVFFGVHEEFERAPRPARVAKGVERFKLALPGGSVLVILVTMGALSLALGLLSPVLSLYVRSLDPTSTRVSTLAGSAVSIAALTSSVAALLIGRLGDKFGQKRILLICALGVAFISIPQALVRTPAQLIALRGIHGIMIGGITPTATAILAMNTPAAKRGTMFGINNSVRAGGRAVGPALGAAISNQWGMASVFYALAGMYVLITGMVAVFVRPTSPATVSEPQVETADCPAS